MTYFKSRTHRSTTLALFVISLIGSSLGIAGNATVPDVPRVEGPIPVTSNSRPFLDASAAMKQVGYVEDEYFLSGKANVYDWAEEGNSVEVVAGPGAYLTRILVRRPKDPARFSGNIEVRVLNATLGYDYGTFADFSRMTRLGDVWIGLSSKRINANALKRFDPGRYGRLNWNNPAQPADRCEDPTFYPAYLIGDGFWMRIFSAAGLVPQTSWPDSEDGLVWDMLAQLGLLLKSDAREQVLPGFSTPSIFMTGISQSSILIRTWVAAFHQRYRLPDGSPIYDGYLAIVGPAMARLNQCSKDVPLQDPRQKFAPPDVPFIDLSSEGEMWISRYTAQPDRVSEQSGIVTYQVAGAAHARVEIPGYPHPRVGDPSEEDLARARPSSSNNFSASLMKRMVLGFSDKSDFPWAPLVRSAYQNLKDWANQGILPPQAPLIALGADGEILRDQFGNALGGVRLPYIDLPLASYRGSISSSGLGGTIGTREPLPESALRSLYPNRQAYLEDFNTATDQLVETRWLLPEDAKIMKASAAEVDLP